MNLEKMKKDLEELNSKETLTDLEVNQKEMLEGLIKAEEKRLKDAEDAKVAEEEAKKLALEKEKKEKVFGQEYVSELREEAKANRIKAQEKEDENKKLMEQLKAVDLDEYTRLKEQEDKIKQEAEAAELERRKKEGEFDQLLAEARTEEVDKFKTKEVDYLSDLEAKQKEINRLVKENDNLAYDKEFNKALQEAGVGIKDPLGLKLRLEREQALEETEDGQKNIVLKDFDTNKIILDESGKPLSMAERIKQLRDDEVTAYMFTSDIEGVGSGTKSEGKKRPVKGNVEDIEYFRLNSPHYSTQKQKQIYGEDLEKYNALMAKALHTR